VVNVGATTTLIETVAVAVVADIEVAVNVTDWVAVRLEGAT
jgi:hypothetical protein